MRPSPTQPAPEHTRGSRPTPRAPRDAETRYCHTCRAPLMTRLPVSPPADDEPSPRWTALCRCPGCRRVYGASAPASHSPWPRVFCRGCRYEVTGIRLDHCPECGRSIDPADPATVAPRAPVPIRRVLLGPTALSALGVLLLLVGLWHSVVPRPFVGPGGWPDWSLWVWLHQPFGVQRTIGPAGRSDVRWWGGRVTAVERYETVQADDGARSERLVWRLERDAEDYHLVADRPGVPLEPILRALNSVRDDAELFGVQVVRTERATLPHPIDVAGAKQDIFETLILAFGMRLVTGYERGREHEVWVWREAQEPGVLDPGWSPQPADGAPSRFGGATEAARRLPPPVAGRFVAMTPEEADALGAPMQALGTIRAARFSPGEAASLGPIPLAAPPVLPAAP